MKHGDILHTGMSHCYMSDLCVRKLKNAPIPSIKELLASLRSEMDFVPL